MKDGRPKRGIDRDLALKVLALCRAVKDSLDDLLDTMFIIYQPTDYTGAVGTRAVFTVVAMNVISYQWQRSSDGGTTWGNSSASGNQTPTLSFSVSDINKSSMWRCSLTDADNNTIYSDSVGIIVPQHKGG